MRGVWRLERSGRRHTPRGGCAGVVGLVGRRSGVGGTALVPALLEAIAVAVHLQDVDVVGKAVEQGSGEAFGAEDLGPLLEGQVSVYLLSGLFGSRLPENIDLNAPATLSGKTIADVTALTLDELLVFLAGALPHAEGRARGASLVGDLRRRVGTPA